MAESIKQKPSALGAPGLPDFRNLGVMLRVLLAVNLFAALTVAMRLDAPGRLVEELALAGRKIAVERNGEIVPKSAHADTLVADGDRLEIVVAVGGG